MVIRYDYFSPCLLPGTIMLCRVFSPHCQILVCFNLVNSGGFVQLQQQRSQDPRWVPVGLVIPWNLYRVASIKPYTANKFEFESTWWTLFTPFGGLLKTCLTQLSHHQRPSQQLSLTGSWQVEVNLRVPSIFFWPVPIFGMVEVSLGIQLGPSHLYQSWAQKPQTWIAW